MGMGQWQYRSVLIGSQHKQIDPSSMLGAFYVEHHGEPPMHRLRDVLFRDVNDLYNIRGDDLRKIKDSSDF